MIIEKGKILVVDDELGMREGIRRILEMQGHAVDTADCGHKGIEKGIATEYDLYFIDLKMPDLEGTQVLREIKLVYPEAICVIVTAYASIDTAVETTRMGAYQYIPKPFEPEELQILVHRALERRWYILEARRLREEQERRLLEVAHEQSRMRTIINALDDGILVINQEGQVVLFNPGFLKLLNITTEITIGDPVLDILPIQLSSQIKEIFANSNQVQAIIQEIVIHPPAKLVIMANTTPILGRKGELLGVVSVLRDISELKKIDIIRSQFVDMAAHELKSPLSAVQGYLELVVDKALGEEQQLYDGYLKRSLERTKSLVNLINDLLNVTRLEAGKVRREIQLQNISDLINDRIDFLKNDINQQNLQVSLDVDSDLQVDADREDLLRLFNQVIGNAVKYNKPDGKITITGHKNLHYVNVKVADTGIGLREEDRQRLFEDFFRAKNEHTRNITGTGLGLTIAKKIVDAYSGKIEVSSEYEKGTTFSIFLPIAKSVKS